MFRLSPTIDFPAILHYSKASIDIDAPSSMGPRKLNILVVDDEPLVADSLAHVLNLFGYEATSVYNTPNLLRRFRG